MTIYQIWESEDGSESTMFEAATPDAEMLARDVDGNKMSYVKSFKAKDHDEAREVFTKYKADKDKDD